PGQVGRGGRRQPAAVHQDGRLRAQPGQGVDGSRRLPEAEEINENGPDQQARVAGGEGAEVFARERRLPPQKGESRPGGCQRFEVGDLAVLKKTHAHAPRPFANPSWKDEASCLVETADYIPRGVGLPSPSRPLFARRAWEREDNSRTGGGFRRRRLYL